jgi:hypothetical protein
MAETESDGFSKCSDIRLPCAWKALFYATPVQIATRTPSSTTRSGGIWKKSAWFKTGSHGEAGLALPG